MQKIRILWADVLTRLKAIDRDPSICYYGVPKSGMILGVFLKNCAMTHNIEEADVILDDIIDSGKTKEFYNKAYPYIPFKSLYSKSEFPEGSWVEFPWETDHPSGGDSVEQNIVRMLQYIGEDVKREGLLSTSKRIVRSWDELYAGYHKDSAELFTTFDKGTYDQMVVLKDIELYSMCEHHMLPFYGKAHVAYIPKVKVAGISKLARLVDLYARRLQIQERIGEQVTNDLVKYLETDDTACVIEAKHMCMCSRGVNKQNSFMVTSSLTGAFKDDDMVRQEFMNLIK